jgi:adenylylsulfate kinase
VSTTDEPKSKNIYWHKGQITRADRERQGGHKGVTIWLTGLSGSGKSTIANRLEEKLFEQGCRTFVLDGDNIRFGLNKDLGFSPKDRTENIRRIGEVAKLFTEAGTIVMTAFISPYREDRNQVRTIMGQGDFLEVFVNADLETCESRDPKGLYKKARAGQIPEFTGISAPYEEPESPEITVHTHKEELDQSVAVIVDYLRTNGYLLNDR